ncbi:hypothetical protein ABW21_db0202675 [Orbilia brochopaga]|nr:hypothetical protein ABW21_db0202675 [Drechslerella brochopaga]
MPSSMTLRSRRRIVSSDGSVSSEMPAAGGSSTTPINLTDTDEDDIFPELRENLRTPSPLSVASDDIIEWAVKPSLRKYIGRIRVQRNQPSTSEGGNGRGRTTKQLMEFFQFGPEQHAEFTDVITRLIDKDSLIRRFDGKTTPRLQKDQICRQLTQHLFDNLHEGTIRQIAELPHEDEEIGYGLWTYFLDRRNGNRSREVYQERKNIQEDDEPGMLREIKGKKQRPSQAAQPRNITPVARRIHTAESPRFNPQDIINRVRSPIRRELSAMQDSFLNITTRTEALEQSHSEHRTAIRDLQIDVLTIGNVSPSPVIDRACQTASATGPSHQPRHTRDGPPTDHSPRARNGGPSRPDIAQRDLASPRAPAAQPQMDASEFTEIIENLIRNQEREQRENQQHRRDVRTEVRAGFALIVAVLVVAILLAIEGNHIVFRF